MTLPRAVWKLLRAQWWIFLNRFRRARGRTRLGQIISAIVLLGLAVGAFWLSWAALSFLQSAEAVQFLGSQLVDSIPVLILSGVFLATFLVSFQVLLQALYLAGDMDFLLSSPVPARAVFVAKMLQAIQPNSVYLGAFTLPVLWGLGAANGYNVLYYPLVLLLLVFQVLAAASLSALLVMAVVRVFPARRVFEVISFVGAILAVLCSQWNAISQSFGNQEADLAPALEQATVSLGQLTSPWVPLSWPGLGLAALAQARWVAALGYLALSISASIGVFVAALYIAERLYYSGWVKVRTSPTRKPRRRPSSTKTATRRIPLLSPAVGGVVLKDLRVLRRDLRNLSQVITSVVVAIVYAIMMMTDGNDGTEGPPAELMQHYAIYFTIFVALFASWMLITRLALMSFSQEGKQYWILRTAPLNAGQLALSKWLVAFLPSVTIGSVLLLGMGLVQKAGVIDIVFGWLVVAFVTAGSTGLTLAFGITGAKFDWTDPRRMTSGSAGCLSALLSMLFQGISLALFLAPAPVLQFLNVPKAVGQLLGLGLGGAFSLLVAFLPPRLVLNRIPTLGEETD
jgi:ABC-2 type transport system permease protein